MSDFSTMHNEEALTQITVFEQQIQEAQNKLKIEEPLELHNFRPHGGNFLVILRPFFYFPKSFLEQLKNEFISLHLTPPSVGKWLQGREKSEKTNPHFEVFFDRFLKIYNENNQCQKNLNHLIRSKFSQLAKETDDLLLKELLLQFIDFLEHHNHPFIEERLPIYYCSKEAEKKLGITQHTPFFESGLLDKNLEAKLLPHYFSLDLLLLNHSHKNLWSLLQKYEHKFLPQEAFHFVFKVGSENEREKLILQISAILGLDSFLMPKKEVTLHHVKIGHKKNPTGLLSGFVQNEQDREWHKLIIKYMSYRSFSNYLLQNPKKQSKMKRWDERAKRLQKKINSLNLQESIEGNLLLDLIFGSYDSHFNQYKVINGKLVNLDFSRFGMPCETYVIEERTYAALCSCLLDSPNLQAPLHSNLKELIRRWDFKAIEEAFSSFIGTHKEFNQAILHIRTLKSESTAVSWAKDTQVPMKFFSHFFKQPDSHLSPRHQKALICHKLTVQGKLLKKKFFQKLHPKAFENIMTRIAIIKSLPNPSLNTIFASLYADFLPFIELLKKMTPSSGLHLAFQRGRKSLERISLEEIVALASIKIDAKENIPAMRDKIASLRLKSSKQADISMMADLYF